MISHIHVRDFAIIDELSLDLRDGLNVITGETGAGKSIIIEAISLALGSRADTTYIRSGKEKAVIELVADTDQPALSAFLCEHDIPFEGQLVIKREISTAGKSVCRINGEIVSVSFLNRLCRMVADIHGQYDHQSLLDPEKHIELLDLYDSRRISPAKEKVAKIFSAYSTVRKELSALLRNEAEARRKLDFMRFEHKEIDDAKLLPGEDEALAQQIHLLQNSEHIYKNLSEGYEFLLEGTPSVLDQLGKAMALISDVASYSQEIQDYSSAVSDCYYKLEDAASEIRKYKDTISFSDEELNEAVARLDLIDGLKRKYGGSIEKVLAYRDTLAASLDKIENLDDHKKALKEKLTELTSSLSEASDTLSRLRQDSAKKMEKEINRELAELNFKDAVLTASFTRLSADGKPVFSENGIDHVEFLISTNKGEAPKPLSKIASGGEISRIMLAFKYITGDLDRIPTMIFDEIDSGISGITASVVGRKMLQIAQNHQLLCITHLPQIAACGHHHYAIRKLTEAERTHTTVVPLNQDEKVQEIARLLGGINITSTTLKNAEELLAFARPETT